ncbi:MAG: hypothetical protein J3K34DRAFT_418325, partial [Monoraphidium minutum]
MFGSLAAPGCLRARAITAFATGACTRQPASGATWCGQRFGLPCEPAPKQTTPRHQAWSAPLLPPLVAALPLPPHTSCCCKLPRARGRRSWRRLCFQARDAPLRSRVIAGSCVPQAAMRARVGLGPACLPPRTGPRSPHTLRSRGRRRPPPAQNTSCPSVCALGSCQPPCPPPLDHRAPQESTALCRPLPTCHASSLFGAGRLACPQLRLALAHHGARRPRCPPARQP